MVDPILRQTQEPPLLHEFNRFWGIPLNSTLTISSAAVILQGAGVYTTTISPITNGVGIHFATHADASALRDMDITLQSGTATSSQVSLSIDGASNVVVERVRFLNAYVSLLLGNSSTGTSASLYDLEVFCNNAAGGAGLRIKYIEGLRAYNVNVMVSGTSNAGFTGIDIAAPGPGLPDTVNFVDGGVGDETVPGNSSSWTALDIHGGTGDYGEWLKFTGCAFEAPNQISSGGWNTQSTVQISAGTSVVFTNCQMKGGANAVNITGGNGIRLIGCVVVAASYEGILHDGSAPTSIIGCTVGGSSFSNTGAYSGIKLGASSQYCSVSGGSSGNGIGALAATQKCGVEVASGASSFFIEGIDCSTNLTSPTTGVVGPLINVALTITPTCQVHHVANPSGGPITFITPPPFWGPVVLIPDAAFTTASTTPGNIALASSATVGRALVMTYDSASAMWYPSY